MSGDRDIEQWSRAWRGDDEGLSDALVGKIRRGTRKIVANLVLEALASASVLVFYGWMLKRNATTLVIVLALANAAFLGIWLYAILRARSGTWRAPAETPRAYAALLVRRAKSNLELVVLALRSTLGLAAAGLVFMPFQIHAYAPLYRAEPWRAVIGVGGFYAIAAGLYVFLRRKRVKVARELEDAERVMAAVGEG